MKTQKIEYQINGATFEAYLAQPDNVAAHCPAVMVVHDWSGRNEMADKKAEQIAELGYIGFAVDMYGKGKVGTTKEEKWPLVEPFLKDRRLVLSHMNAALNTLKTLPQVDPKKIAAIGFCFGGLCVLDLARSGADIQGVASFHGLFIPPENLTTQKITAKVLVLHGYDDPQAPPEGIKGFAEEMQAAQADWQVHFYGNTVHAFTNPLANDPAFGTVYSKTADQRSWISMKNFLTELFGA